MRQEVRRGENEWQKTDSSIPKAFIKHLPGTRHVPERGNIARWKGTEVLTVGEAGRDLESDQREGGPDTGQASQSIPNWIKPAEAKGRARGAPGDTGMPPECLW